jgi:hypothetical protein
LAASKASSGVRDNAEQVSSVLICLAEQALTFIVQHAGGELAQVLDERLFVQHEGVGPADMSIGNDISVPSPLW